MRTESPSFLGIKKIDLSDDTQVNSGGNENIQTLQPPIGQIYQLCAVEMDIPAIGGATGTQSVYIRYSNYINATFGRLDGTNGAQLLIIYNQFIADTEIPSTATEQTSICTNSWVSYDEPIEFRYYNNSDVNQTGTRKLKVWVKVYKELL